MSAWRGCWCWGDSPTLHVTCLTTPLCAPPRGSRHLLDDKLCSLDLSAFTEQKLRAFRCLFLRINQRAGNIHLSTARHPQRPRESA